MTNAPTPRAGFSETMRSGLTEALRLLPPALPFLRPDPSGALIAAELEVLDEHLTNA